MTTVAQLEANRRNALKSTGPKTPEGKAKSSQNARKHGLYAKAPVTPGEEARRYHEWVEEWRDHYQPDGPAANLLIERAAHAGWRLHRCAQVEAAQLSKKVRHATVRFSLEERERAEALGRRLLASRLLHLRKRRPILEVADALGENPAALQRALCSFAEGVDWLLGRWNALLRTLDDEGKWEEYDRLQAVALLGKHPEHALDDPELTALFVHCHATVDNLWDLWGDFCRAGATGEGKPQYCDRVDALKSNERTATNPDAARAFLRALADREIERLAALKTQVLDPLATLDRDEAADRAAFDDSTAGASLRRYESACTRDLHTALRDLARLPTLPPRCNEPTPEDIVAQNVATDASRPSAPVADVPEPQPPAVTVTANAAVPMPTNDAETNAATETEVTVNPKLTPITLAAGQATPRALAPAPPTWNRMPHHRPTSVV